MSWGDKELHAYRRLAMRVLKPSSQYGTTAQELAQAFLHAFTHIKDLTASRNFSEEAARIDRNALHIQTLARIKAEELGSNPMSVEAAIAARALLRSLGESERENE